MKKFYFLFLFALIASISNLYATEKTVTYTFTSKTWEAAEGNWNSLKNGDSKEARGVAVTNAVSGASAESPSGFSKITSVNMVWSTSGKGVGTINMYISDNKVGSKTVGKSMSNQKFSVVTDPSTTSGVVKFDVKCTKGTIYIKSISITYEEAAETKCAQPTFNLTADATYTDVQDLVITSTTEGAQIEYKIEGDKLTAPITGKQASPATVHLTANGTYMVTATATKEGLDASAADLMFTIAKKCAAPTFSLVSGSYTTAQTVTITGPEGSTITYTLNGDIFDAPSPVNVELPLVEGVSTTYNLSALASMKDFKDSEETKAVYVINESYADKTVTLNIANYASANGWTNGEQYPSAEIDDVKFTVKGGGIDGKYYKSNYSWRVYASTPGTLTISVPAMHIISSVVYKAANAFVKADSGTLSKGTKTDEWKWNAAATNTTEGDPVNSVIFTAGDNKNVELKEIIVYYAYDPVSSVSSMSSEGVKVFAAEGGVEVVAEEAAEVAVYTAAGQLVRQARVAEGSTLVNVAPGFYVVRANGTATKVIVR